MSSIADALLQAAREHLGYREEAGGYTKFGDWYYTHIDDSTPYFKTAPWCDMFVTWAGHRAGIAEYVGEFAHTVSHARWFQEQGAWSDTPEPGAVVFFDWSRTGLVSGIDHVGIVERVEGRTIHTIEGNADRVWLKRKVRDEATVVGYGLPRKVQERKAQEARQQAQEQAQQSRQQAQPAQGRTQQTQEGTQQVQEQAQQAQQAQGQVRQQAQQGGQAQEQTQRQAQGRTQQQAQGQTRQQTQQIQQQAQQDRQQGGSAQGRNAAAAAPGGSAPQVDLTADGGTAVTLQAFARPQAASADPAGVPPLAELAVPVLALLFLLVLLRHPRRYRIAAVALGRGRHRRRRGVRAVLPRPRRGPRRPGVHRAGR